MDSLERVMAALEHRPPDRIPKFDSFWAEFASRARAELGLQSDVNLDDHFGIDITIAVADETPFPTRAVELSREGDEVVRRDGWGRVVRERAGAYFSEVLDVPVKAKGDLDRLAFDSPTMDARYAGFLRTVDANRDRRAVFCKTGGPFLRTSFMRGKVEFLMDIAGDPPFAKALSDRVADHIIEIGVESLRRGDLCDTGLWIYDDMAHNLQPFPSPRSFERVFLPAYRRMVRAFKNAGAAQVILHSDGDISPLLDMLVDAGIDGINPVEPKAGMHLPTLKERYGGRLSLIGGMCNSHTLPFGSEDDICAETREIVDVAGDGGVIIGAHSIGPDIPVRSYVAYDDAVRRHAPRAA
ncbi:hypothetical protein CMK11_16605 [Candidatus Poribacteria bacterium]|nr:hypothetical protein [Candidatus Poribacteria bacterium]